LRDVGNLYQLSLLKLRHQPSKVRGSNTLELIALPVDAFTNPRAHPSLSFAVPRDPVLPGAPGRLLIVHGQTQRRIPLVPYSPSRFQ